MRRIALASVALSALVTSFVVPAAEASPPTPGPRGRLCSYSAASDPAPDADDDAMTGQVNGGPLVWSQNFWLHCHIQVDNNTHTGPVAPGGDVHGPSDPHSSSSDEVAIVASQVVYESPEDSQDYLCTSVSWPTATGPNWLYWHPTDDNDTPNDPSDDEAGHWTPTNTKPCSAATQASTGPVIDAINDLIIDVVDPALCSVLATMHHDNTETYGDKHPGHDGPNPGQPIYVDAEGDVFIEDGDGWNSHPGDWRDELWWDCPAYVDFTQNPIQPGDDGLPSNTESAVYDY